MPFGPVRPGQDVLRGILSSVYFLLCKPYDNQSVLSYFAARIKHRQGSSSGCILNIHSRLSDPPALFCPCIVHFFAVSSLPVLSRYFASTCNICHSRIMFLRQKQRSPGEELNRSMRPRSVMNTDLSFQVASESSIFI